MFKQTLTIPPLIDFIVTLRRQNVKFCVLSGYEGLPLQINGSDVDIVVSKKDLQKTTNILKEVFKKHGSERIVVQRYIGRDTFLFYFFNDEGTCVESLKIDLFINFEFRGRVFLTAREILADSQLANNIYIPGLTHRAFMGLVKGLMKGGKAWKKYLPRIREGMLTAGNEIEALLKRIFNEKTVTFLTKNLNNGNINEIEKIREILIYQTYAISFVRSPIYFPLRFFSYCLKSGYRAIKPPPYMIAILGPDGVGKSTLINLVQNDLNNVMKCGDTSKSFHIRPGLFPTVTEMLKKRGHSSEKDSKTLKAWKSNAFVVSLARLICFWTDYILGYLFKILPEINNYNVVVLDRYFYDIVIDPLRYNIKLPYKIMKFFPALLPKPEVTIVLDAPPKVIMNRKKELTINQIDTLLNRYRNLRSQFSKIYILDAEKTPERLSNEVLSIFIKNIATKLA